MQWSNRSRGFTLIELMIVLVVIGVLASIAYPAYRDQMRKGRRADAISSLLKIQLDQEKFRGNHAKYADCITVNGACTAGISLGWGTLATAVTEQGYYDLAIKASSATATGYIAIATPNSGDQLNDTHCASIAVDQNGPYLNSPETTNSDCWNR